MITDRSRDFYCREFSWSGQIERLLRERIGLPHSKRKIPAKQSGTINRAFRRCEKSSLFILPVTHRNMDAGSRSGDCEQTDKK